MLREDEYLAIYMYLIHSSHVVEVDAEHSFCLKWAILMDFMYRYVASSFGTFAHLWNRLCN